MFLRYIFSSLYLFLAVLNLVFGLILLFGFGLHHVHVLMTWLSLVVYISPTCMYVVGLILIIKQLSGNEIRVLVHVLEWLIAKRIKFYHFSGNIFHF
jgi:hypothetical protein